MIFYTAWSNCAGTDNFVPIDKLPSKKRYPFLNFKNKTIDFSVGTRYYDYIRVTLHIMVGQQKNVRFSINEFLKND